MSRMRPLKILQVPANPISYYKEKATVAEAYAHPYPPPPILGVYPPPLADQTKPKASLFQGFGLVQSHFTYIANGQFPPPYPLKHSFSLPLYLTLKKPKSVRPIFTFCPSYLSFHKSFLLPKHPKSRHLHPTPFKHHSAIVQTPSTQSPYKPPHRAKSQ